ncbi:MAG: cupin domain-containing protein [Anaerolineaceae bacterium]|jgi:ethanolamine utilization protein EutQ|nr:cupin domain-containing protein [Anaerolineaceae bacterium]
MQRQFFTARDVFQLTQEQKSSTLVLGPDDVITHEAEDVAAVLGLRLIRQKPGGHFIQKEHSFPVLPPLFSVKNQIVVLEPFGESSEAQKVNVKLKDVITSEQGSPMSSGYMTLEKGEFPWKLTYDEIDIILEGELVITRGCQVITGKPGDTLFIPKGSDITFGTPNHVRFVYVTYPADWNK